MGAYKNFIKDFPSRILKLYETQLDSANYACLEVTFLVSLTATAIAVPFDRLRDPSKGPYPHLSGDRHKYSEAASRFDELCNMSFNKSALWDSAFDTWQWGIIYNISGDPDSWPELRSASRIGADVNTEKIIKHLRDALAHGNIYTRGDKLIKEIVLLTGTSKKGFRFLVVSPQSLGVFLRKWVSWLMSLPISV
ncbi:MAG: hypothetical protein HYV36_05060 [Lentisphaerae bacterium]|nr:hypothetical protein [Lentisphaerota bacterium]